MGLRRSRSAGFTLMELLIAVAIVAILAAIAVPSYQQALVKGRRADAVAVIGQVAQQLQSYKADNKFNGAILRPADERYTYLGFNPASYGLDTSPANPDASEQIYYTICVQLPRDGSGVDCSVAGGPMPPAPANPNNTYLIVAIPAPGSSQTTDTFCASLTLNELGQKGITGTGTVDRCW